MLHDMETPPLHPPPLHSSVNRTKAHTNFTSQTMADDPQKGRDKERDSMIFKPNGEHMFSSTNGLITQSNENVAAEDLFLQKNIFRDVQQKVTSGPIKTTTIEKVTKIPKVVFRERLKDKVVKEKKIITKEVEIEQIIDVIENKEEIIYNEVKVPTYIDVPVVHPRQEVYHTEILKNIPKGIELLVTQRLEVPKIKPKYVEVQVPIYVPCYIEVPIPAQYIPIPKGEKKDHFTCGINKDKKIYYENPVVYNNPLMRSALQSETIQGNYNHHLNLSGKCHLDGGDNKSEAIYSSKSSVQNLAVEQSSLDNLVAAGAQ
ncbi:hypothetical protein PCYB_132790 [Plasmodium cynomolgi strain B]|uniref:Uncharacterized protein n=1 Tax=Plasmodium cynomolgi (strain B) TaxID=1120755 RepID=K6V078_PLACD|nr:hypothetical protein PCYB_132790 [Plasmodium cynomolgi strain B]GAB68405.1 hypothetical protein PCYB_132790 [Plasmodium cynomolgi strain B]